jgi:hypothetical protein
VPDCPAFLKDSPFRTSLFTIFLKTALKWASSKYPPKQIPESSSKAGLYHK